MHGRLGSWGNTDTMLPVVIKPPSILMPLSLSRRISIIVSAVIAPISDTKQSFTHSAIYAANWYVFCNCLLLTLVGSGNLTLSVLAKIKKPNHTSIHNTSKYRCFSPKCLFQRAITFMASKRRREGGPFPQRWGARGLQMVIHTVTFHVKISSLDERLNFLSIGLESRTQTIILVIVICTQIMPLGCFEM